MSFVGVLGLPLKASTRMEKVPPTWANHDQRSLSDQINHSKQPFQGKNCLDYLLIRLKLLAERPSYIKNLQT